jgi:2-polyprenyl-3-methyl-5-hydroxy-6-metoxy-1,4-benzoquinol methylase
MTSDTVEKLQAINREFYTRFAQTFAATRSVERMNVAPIMPYLADGVKVLEVGCGNGRLAERLDREGLRLRYVGADMIPELITIAEARQSQLHHVSAEFHVADISTREGREMLQAHAPFDVMLMLAVLHHIPSFALRCEVLRAMHELLRDGGMLVMSNWQFTHNARLRRKIAPWITVGIDADELEAGDALLDWQREGTGYRYCHLVTEAEVESLATQSGLQLITQFYADEDLNLYSVLKRPMENSPNGKSLL